MLSFFKYFAVVFQNALSDVFSYPTSFWSHARWISGVLLYLCLVVVYNANL